MKEITLFLAFIGCLASCSDDSVNSVSVEIDEVLLHSTTKEYEGDIVSAVIFNYDGFKIDHLDYDDGETSIFTYEGYDITSIKTYDATGAIADERNFVYANGQITVYTLYQSMLSTTTKRYFEYPDANTITGEVYQINEAGSNPDQETFLFDEIYTKNSDGEITAIQRMYPTGENHTLLYAYDTENNPMRNVVGYDKITVFMPQVVKGSNHNMTSENDGDFESTYTFTYNSNDFPATAVEDFDGDVYTTQFFYH